MPKIDIANLPVDSRSNYPEPFNRVVVGRSRKRLGIAAGLDQFGVNLTTLKPGAASALRHWHEKEDELVYILEGEVVLVEDGGETRAQGRATPPASRPACRTAIICQQIEPRRGLSRNRHALETRARRISRRRLCGSSAMKRAHATRTRTASPYSK